MQIGILACIMRGHTLSELSFYKPLGGWDQITALCFKYLDSECTYMSFSG